MTLEKYFREALERGQVEHHVRVQMGADGQPRFYIHPSWRSGRTADFTVVENGLTCLHASELPPLDGSTVRVDVVCLDVQGHEITGP